jgi:hypothetical protein
MSLPRTTTSGKILKPYKTKRGYERVCLSKNNVKKYFSVHRIVALAFIEKVDGKNHINHINGIKDDNKAENLEWCTARENELHSYRVLGKKPTRYWLGKAMEYRRMFTPKEIIAIRDDERPSRVIAREFGVSKTSILNIRKLAIYKEI